MTEVPKRGEFICLEGGDGSGKSKQVALLKERYPSLFPGRTFEFTREPGGGPDYSKDIRELALHHPEAGDAHPGTQLSLMIGSRFEHLDKFVIPHLKAGTHVISDRFEAASFAYQIVAEGADFLRDMYHGHRAAVRHMLGPTEPHIVILDVPPEVAMERLAARKEEQGDQNHFDLRPRDYHERVREGLLEGYCKTINPTAVVIDGSGTPEEVHELIVVKLREILGA